MDAARADQAPEGNGQIPFTFRIGVTGHREFTEPEAVRAAVRDAIRQLKEFLPISADQGLVLTVVSPLAEGADRLVAEEVLAEEGARLEVAMPMATDDYLRDFEDESSKQEFKSLLERASHVWQVPAGSYREHGYEQAGRYVVDRSDAVIAIWDGKPPRGHGGTGYIVQYARHRKVTLIVVGVDGDPSVRFDQKPPAVLPGVAREMARYNTRTVDDAKFHRQLSELQSKLLPGTPAGTATDALGASRDRVAEWLFPYFARAEVLARDRQKWFMRLSPLIFLLAAAAVVVVAAQSNFRWSEWIDVLEVIFLGAVVGIILANRRKHFRDRWISYRFLAERLRSTYFLTLAGVSGESGSPTRRMTTANSSQAWVERALLEIIGTRPEQPTGIAPPVVTLRGYLSQYWIEDQRQYLEKTSHRQHKLEEQLTHRTIALFVVTALVAIFHVISYALGYKTGDDLVVTFSISVPAIGAAVHGLNAQRQYGRHAERYRRVAEQLGLVHDAMEKAGSLDRVRRYAAKTERILLQENSDWFGVMRFLDMELIT